MKRLKIRILTTLAIVLATLAAHAAPGVRMRVDAGRGRNTVALGQNFYLQIEVTDMNDTPSKPENIPGAKLLYFGRTGSSSSFTSVNGRTTQSSSYTYTATLRAEKEGNYTFGPISVGGHASNTVSYVIGKPAPDPAAQAQQPGASNHRDPNADPSKPQFIGKGDGDLFLVANVSKSSAYEQEALVYTVKLYSSYSAVKFIGATSAPKFEGFVIEESKDISNQLTFETYKGKQYGTAIIARYIIFPQMKGDLKVIGNTYTVSVDEAEYYHDAFFGRMAVSRPLQLNVTPNDLTIHVRPLPEPKPADFSGGVGNFTISSVMPSGDIQSNHAATVQYTVSGTGNIKYVNLPELSTLYPSEIEVYTPETDVQVKVGSSNVSGSVRFDYGIMPLEAGNFTIPPVTLCWFNPSTGKYERASAKGANIKVTPGKGSDKSQSLLGVAFDSKLMPVVAPLSKKHIPSVYTFPYWLWYIIPTLLLVALILIYRKRLGELQDLTTLRSKKAGSVARKRLRKAAAAMKANKPDLFYEEILKAVWGYLGDKLKMPTSELSRSNVKDELEKAAVDADVIGKVIDIVDECEFARYSPINKSAGMKPLYDRTAETIGAIDKSFGKKKAEGNKVNGNDVTTVSEPKANSDEA